MRFNFYVNRIKSEEFFVFYIMNTPLLHYIIKDKILYKLQKILSFDLLMNKGGRLVNYDIILNDLHQDYNNKNKFIILNSCFRIKCEQKSVFCKRKKGLVYD